MSATNSVMTPYNLTYQAKDTLKSYIPKLHITYNAQELDDEHPLRYVNQAGGYDRDSSREHLDGPLQLCDRCSSGGPATHWTRDLEDHLVATPTE